MQKTMTTVVDPIVSARVGNETFFNSPRTSLKNSRIELYKILEHAPLTFTLKKRMPSSPSTRPLSPTCHTELTRNLAAGIDPDPSTTQRLAGALGFEPRLSVLETDVLPLTPCPYDSWQPSH